MEYAKRVHRDMQNLFSHDFTSSSTSLCVSDVPETDELLTWRKQSSGAFLHTVMINICVHEGPYRGGHFIFYLNIPESYPFRGVDVWVDMSRPVWHPNVELETGRVLLPLTWSPVLTLTSLAIAIEMMLLEPSADYPLNLEACSFYSDNPVIFEKCVQKTLGGCVVGHVLFQPMDQLQCACCRVRRQSQAAAASASIPGHVQPGKRCRSAAHSSPGSGMQVASTPSGSQGLCGSTDDDADGDADDDDDDYDDAVDVSVDATDLRRRRDKDDEDDEDDEDEQENVNMANSSKLSARGRKRRLQRNARLAAACYVDDAHRINIGQLSKEFGAILDNCNSSPRAVSAPAPAPTSVPAPTAAAARPCKRRYASLSAPADAAAYPHLPGAHLHSAACAGSGFADSDNTGMELQDGTSSRSGSLGGEKHPFHSSSSISTSSSKSASRSASAHYSPTKRARSRYDSSGNGTGAGADAGAGTSIAAKGFAPGSAPPLPPLHTTHTSHTSHTSGDAAASSSVSHAVAHTHSYAHHPHPSGQ